MIGQPNNKKEVDECKKFLEDHLNSEKDIKRFTTPENYHWNIDNFERDLALTLYYKNPEWVWYDEECCIILKDTASQYALEELFIEKKKFYTNDTKFTIDKKTHLGGDEHYVVKLIDNSPEAKNYFS